MAACRRVYDLRHLQADCQEPGSAPEPYAGKRVWATFFHCGKGNFAVISGHVFQNTHSKTFVCTRFSVPASQTQRPRVHVPCPLQRVGSPGQLTSSTCRTRLLTKSGCRSGSSLVLFSVDLISKMQRSSMSSTSPSRKSVKLSTSCNKRHNSQLATMLLRFFGLN